VHHGVDDTMVSLHVRRAIAGDVAGFSWIVERYTPALLLLAERRMGETARAAATPDDVLQHVWLTALRRLPELAPERGHTAATLVSFLSTVLLRHVRDLCVKMIRRGGANAPGGADGDLAPADSAESSLTGAVTHALRAERQHALAEAVANLDPVDHEIVVRRAFENEACADIGADLGLEPNTVAQRYRRALAKLRVALPASVFADLDDGSA
jgi:RNA polymerase sigma factor (sigma-70 family)